jgi:uncharacterized spore protein YtfJ
MTSQFAATSEEMVRRITTIQDEVGANACFGTPVERDGKVVIPVARISFGYGMGFGGGSGTDADEFGDSKGGGEGGGGGGGGGGSSTPVAVIEMTRDQVSIRPIEDTTRISISGMMLVAWAVFWIGLTIRTLARENAKTKRAAIEK